MERFVTSVSSLPSAASFRHYFKTIIERISDYVRLAIFEYQLRREFRRPLGKGPEATGKWPKLNEATRLRSNSKISTVLPNWTGKNLNEQFAHAKRRDLSIVCDSGD